MKDNKFTRWIKTHKSELLVVSGVVIATAGGFLLIRNRDFIMDFALSQSQNPPNRSTEVMKETPMTPIVADEPIIQVIDVREHLRNLPHGHHPSEPKIEEAANMGIKLLENQTLVSSYPRHIVAA